MSGGRSPKRKGVRIERMLAQQLLKHGVVCARVPLSGAAGGAWSGDIHLELLGRTCRVEVKARHAFTSLYRWLSRADLLLLKADRLDPIAVLPLRLLAELIAAAKPTVPSDSKPRRPRKDEDPSGTYWFEDAVRKERLNQYARNDVEAEREVCQRLHPLTPEEQQLWLPRGVRVDRQYAEALREIAKASLPELNAGLAQLTTGAVATVNQVARLKTSRRR
jgi:hypothetical protein